ncbi:MAG: hypothetical protein AAFO04_05020 [Cyanobacteria bacterium J06592_8]
MTQPKHIAMWTAPRSRSTLISRAFEQLDECWLIDEPFYAPYALTHDYGEPERELVLELCDTNYQNVIRKITGELPKDKSFSFQKQISKHALPKFGREWLLNLHNFFLIRNPKEVILSYQKILHDFFRKDRKINQHDVGIHYLSNIFREVKAILGKPPLVIDSTDLIKNPARGLKLLCNDHLGVTFSDKMLTWEPGLKNSNLFFTGDLFTYAEVWYSQVSNSQGFKPYKESEVEFPEELLPLLNDCEVVYKEMYQYCTFFNH